MTDFNQMGRHAAQDHLAHQARLTFRPERALPRKLLIGLGALAAMAALGVVGQAVAPSHVVGPAAAVRDPRDSTAYRRQVEGVCESSIEAQVAHPETLEFSYFTRSSSFDPATGWTVTAPFKAGNLAGATGHFVGLCTEDKAGVVSANVVGGNSR